MGNSNMTNMLISNYITENHYARSNTEITLDEFIRALCIMAAVYPQNTKTANL